MSEIYGRINGGRNVYLINPNGILFGAGWAVMGFCPGTSIGALGEGRWHAVFAILGMLPCALALVFGWRVVWALAYPLAFLIFAVPFGDFLVPTLQAITAAPGLLPMT